MLEFKDLNPNTFSLRKNQLNFLSTEVIVKVYPSTKTESSGTPKKYYFINYKLHFQRKICLVKILLNKHWVGKKLSISISARRNKIKSFDSGKCKLNKNSHVREMIQQTSYSDSYLPTTPRAQEHRKNSTLNMFGASISPTIQPTFLEANRIQRERNLSPKVANSLGWKSHDKHECCKIQFPHATLLGPRKCGLPSAPAPRLLEWRFDFCIL